MNELRGGEEATFVAERSVVSFEGGKSLSATEYETPSNLSESSMAASSAMTRMRSRTLPAKFLTPVASALSRTISSLCKGATTKKEKQGGHMVTVEAGVGACAFRSWALVEGADRQRACHTKQQQGRNPAKPHQVIQWGCWRHRANTIRPSPQRDNVVNTHVFYHDCPLRGIALLLVHATLR